MINIFYDYDISVFSLKKNDLEEIVALINEIMDFLSNRIVNIYVASNEKIKDYNAKYRNKDVPTDVLSFSYGDEKEAGDIIIAPEIIYENALMYGENFIDELIRIIIHGILHIFGYDHEKKEEAKKMFELQENYFCKVRARLEEKFI
jgi:probable rRNA maturation factor